MLYKKKYHFNIENLHSESLEIRNWNFLNVGFIYRHINKFFSLAVKRVELDMVQLKMVI